MLKLAAYTLLPLLAFHFVHFGHLHFALGQGVLAVHEVEHHIRDDHNELQQRKLVGGDDVETARQLEESTVEEPGRSLGQEPTVEESAVEIPEKSLVQSTVIVSSAEQPERYLGKEPNIEAPGSTVSSEPTAEQSEVSFGGEPEGSLGEKPIVKASGGVSDEPAVEKPERSVSEDLATQQLTVEESKKPLAKKPVDESAIKVKKPTVEETTSSADRPLTVEQSAKPEEPTANLVESDSQAPKAASSVSDDAVGDADQEYFHSEMGEELLELSVDCDSVPAFPTHVFHEQSDISKVYLHVSDITDELFAPLGFDKYLMVFGVPVLGTESVTKKQLLHAAKIFAGFLDNDGDGVPDRQSALDAVHGFQTVIGYVSGPAESEDFWSTRFEAAAAEQFRNQFACNMHFFEHWATDLTPEFYNKPAAVHGDADSCALIKADFDWPLWYFPFTISYYGYIEDFNDETIKAIKAALERARTSGYFLGTYSDDPEMEIADFFVWSLLTKLGALECHCKDDIIGDVWQLCASDDLLDSDKEWFDLLNGGIRGLPKKLPGPNYTGPAVVQQ